jgi:hypothetical protein
MKQILYPPSQINVDHPSNIEIEQRSVQEEETIIYEVNKMEPEFYPGYPQGKITQTKGKQQENKTKQSVIGSVPFFMSNQKNRDKKQLK